MNKLNIKILFVCESCVDRSKTFAKKMNEIAGVEATARGTQAYYKKDDILEQDLIDNDEIFVMTYKEAFYIQDTFGSKFDNKLKVIGVENSYSFMTDELLRCYESFYGNWLKKKHQYICNQCKVICNLKDSFPCAYLNFSYGSNFDEDSYLFCSDKCLKDWTVKNIK